MYTSSFLQWAMEHEAGLCPAVAQDRGSSGSALYVRSPTTRQQHTRRFSNKWLAYRSMSRCSPTGIWPGDIYRDDGYSGAKLQRPGLDRLRDRAALAAFEQVRITAPDRLARNYVHQLLLIDELSQRGCRVEFLDRPMRGYPETGVGKRVDLLDS